jgi:hypothetical protein
MDLPSGKSPLPFWGGSPIAIKNNINMEILEAL